MDMCVSGHSYNKKVTVPGSLRSRPEGARPGPPGLWPPPVMEAAGAAYAAP